MKALIENSVFVSEITQAPGLDFGKYKVECTSIPKTVNILPAGTMIKGQSIGVDKPNIQSLYGDYCAVYPLNLTYNNIEINVYKHTTYWDLQNTITTPRVGADHFVCNDVSLYDDKLMISTTQWLGQEDAVYNTYLYILNESTQVWGITNTINTDNSASIKLYKDKAIIAHGQTIDIITYIGTWNEQGMETITDTDLPNDNAVFSDIDMTDDTFAIGSSTNGSGIVKVYKLDGTWVLNETLTPEINPSYNEFGYSVSLNGSNECLVTSKYSNQGVLYHAGLYVFNYDTEINTWAETQWIEDTGLFSLGTFISVENDTGVTSGESLVSLTKTDKWYLFTVPDSTGMGDLNQCNIDPVYKMTGCSDYSNNKIQFFDLTDTNTKTTLRTDDIIEIGTKGLIYDGVSVKKGIFGNTSAGFIEIVDFELADIPHFAWKDPVILSVSVENTENYCIGYDKPLHITSILEMEAKTTETSSGLLNAGDIIILTINNSNIEVLCTGVSVVVDGSDYNYTITYDSLGVVPTNIKIKSRGVIQNPKYRYNTTTEILTEEYLMMTTAGKYASITAQGNINSEITYLKLGLYVKN